MRIQLYASLIARKQHLIVYWIYIMQCFSLRSHTCSVLYCNIVYYINYVVKQGTKNCGLCRYYSYILGHI